MTWLIPSAMAFVADESTSSNKVLMCTQNGYQWVEIVDSTEPLNRAPQSIEHCDLCVLSDLRDGLVFNNPATSLDLVVNAVAKRSRHADRVSHGFYLHDSPGRAPPLC